MEHEYTLTREPGSDYGTPGTLRGPDGRVVCHMMEPPWRDNRTGMSCIPAGTYPVRHLPRSASGKYRDVYAIGGTGSRVGILIHKGNYAGDSAKGYRTDSYGCLMPCAGFGVVRGAFIGLGSGGGLARLHAATGRKPWRLTITGG